MYFSGMTKQGSSSGQDSSGGLGKFGTRIRLLYVTIDRHRDLHNVTFWAESPKEKESRMMEILLSSITHQELLIGKLIGAGSAGLTQLGIWAVMGSIPAAIGYVALAPLVHISLGLFLLAGLLFVLAFAFYGTLIGAIGSLGSSWKESQQITGIIMMMMVIPLMFMPAIIDQPNGIPARILSWFPPTAAQTLMMRASAGDVAWWDEALTIGLLIGAVMLIQNISARLFPSLGLLLQGKTPTLTRSYSMAYRSTMIRCALRGGVPDNSHLMELHVNE